jgi:hypothetical protein
VKGTILIRTGSIEVDDTILTWEKHLDQGPCDVGSTGVKVGDLAWRADQAGSADPNLRSRARHQASDISFGSKPGRGGALSS